MIYQSIEFDGIIYDVETTGSIHPRAAIYSLDRGLVAVLSTSDCANYWIAGNNAIHKGEMLNNEDAIKWAITQCEEL